MKHPPFSLIRLMPVFVVAALSVAMVACETQPRERGRTAGRVEPGATTGGEAASPQVLPAELSAFADQASRQLVMQLSQLQYIKDSPDQVRIMLGDLNNLTHAVNTTDFEYAMRKLRSNLLNTADAREQLRFVETRRRMSRQAERERVVGGDGHLADPEAYAADITYALNGDFHEVTRMQTRLYYMEFTLVNFANNEIVWSSSYEVKQVQKR